MECPSPGNSSSINSFMNPLAEGLLSVLLAFVPVSVCVCVCVCVCV
jgi:hypothetical protein